MIATEKAIGKCRQRACEETLRMVRSRRKEAGDGPHLLKTLRVSVLRKAIGGVDNFVESLGDVRDEEPDQVAPALRALALQASNLATEIELDEVRW